MLVSMTSGIAVNTFWMRSISFCLSPFVESPWKQLIPRRPEGQLTHAKAFWGRCFVEIFFSASATAAPAGMDDVGERGGRGEKADALL